jgi:hypothetical protein
MASKLKQTLLPAWVPLTVAYSPALAKTQLVNGRLTPAGTVSQRVTAATGTFPVLAYERE